MKDHIITFDDILAELVLEEATPSYETLLKWQARYPKFRDTLADYFAIWAIQSEPIDELPEIDEEEIVEKGVAYAMNILRDQGRLIPEDHIETVNAFDQSLLAAMYVVRGGDAVDIAEKISAMSGSEASLGATLMSLTRLEEKGLIESWKSDGSSRKHFNITIAGERALAYAKETSRVVEGLLGDLA